MTSISYIGSGWQPADPITHVSTELPGELSIGIAEAVILAPDQLSRCDVIGSLVRQVSDSLAALHGPDSDNEEVLSFRRVLAEVDVHASRMSVLGEVMDRPPGDAEAM